MLHAAGRLLHTALCIPPHKHEARRGHPSMRTKKEWRALRNALDLTTRRFWKDFDAGAKDAASRRAPLLAQAW